MAEQLHPNLPELIHTTRDLATATAEDLPDLIQGERLLKAAQDFTKGTQQHLETNRLWIEYGYTLGRVLLEMEKNKGHATKKCSNTMLPHSPTLSDMGIHKMAASRWQQIAGNIADEIVQAYVEEQHQKKEPATQAALLRMVANSQNEIIRRGNAEMPGGRYSVIYADPPWSYGDDRKGLSSYGGAGTHYPTMSIDELCQLPVHQLAAENSVLFLWTTSPLLESSFEVINAWGFNYKTSFVWDKEKHNFGHYNSVRHEFLLVCTRGSYTPLAQDRKLHDSVVSIPKTDKHSEKPEEFRQIIDQIYPDGPKIELFARREVAGWKSWGNEIAQP